MKRILIGALSLITIAVVASCSGTDKKAVITPDSALMVETDTAIITDSLGSDTLTQTVISQVVDQSILPGEAAKVLSTYFKDAQIANIKQDKDGYEVKMANGTEVEFNTNGAVEEISCKGQDVVPEALIPQPVREYVAANYAGQKVVKLEAEKNGYDVKLASGVKLDFDKAGKFLRIDD